MAVSWEVQKGLGFCHCVGCPVFEVLNGGRVIWHWDGVGHSSLGII